MAETEEKTATLKLTPWDAAEYIQTEEDVIEHLNAAFEDGDPAVIRSMLGHIARSTGMTKIAERAGLGRESLYKALSEAGNPKFQTILKVLQALDLKLSVTRL